MVTFGWDARFRMMMLSWAAEMGCLRVTWSSIDFNSKLVVMTSKYYTHSGVLNLTVPSQISCINRENWSLHVVTWSKLFSSPSPILETPFSSFRLFRKAQHLNCTILVSWCMSSRYPADRSSPWCLLPHCHLRGLERAGLVNHFTVLILLHPLLQRQLKLLTAALVSPRWIIRWRGDSLFRGC